MLCTHPRKAFSYAGVQGIHCLIGFQGRFGLGWELVPSRNILQNKITIFQQKETGWSGGQN